MHKLQEKPSALKREHPALQNMKFLYFFPYLWVIFALRDPEPATLSFFLKVPSCQMDLLESGIIG
jgi:hypothetical protein